MRTSWMMVAVLPVLLGGCRANEELLIESVPITFAKHAFMYGRFAENPVPFTQANLAEGKELYEAHCSVCHGLDGQLTGVPFATQTEPQTRNLAEPEVQDYTDGQLKWVIDNGIFPSGMPAWRAILTDEEQWQIVHYLRNLPPKGSLGVPEAYEGHEDIGERHTHGEARPPG